MVRWIAGAVVAVLALSCAHATAPEPEPAKSEEAPRPIARRRPVATFDPLALDIPDPPRLPAVPDPASPDDDQCPTPPRAEIAACRATMPCPDPPDRRVKRCHPAWPDPGSDTLPPVIGRIIAVTFQDSSAIIVVTAGSNHYVTKNWTAAVLRGDTDQRLPGGEIVVLRVEKQLFVGRTQLTGDQLEANPRVVVTPP